MLEFKTATTRDKIKIDGVAYDLIGAGEMNLRDYFRIQKQGEKVINLKEDDFESEEKVKMVSDTIDDVVAFLVKAPENIRKKLTDAQKLQVITFFLKRKQELQPKKKWKLFRGSKDSTVGIPGNG